METSMVVAGLITFITAVHYMYMRDFWVAQVLHQQYIDILIGY